MERVSQVLQFPVVIKWSWSSSLKPQPFQKLDFTRRGVPVEGSILKEFLEPGLFLERMFDFPFNELELFRVPWG